MDFLKNLNSDVHKESGLTWEELAIMDLLIDARNMYQSLPVQHPSEPQDFDSAIHTLQQLLALRVVRRDYPGIWKVVDRAVPG